jgi:hypothetical protein
VLLSPALDVNVCDKNAWATYTTCLGFVPACRPAGFDCTPGNTTAQSVYITAYPVSVRSVVDKSMEIEVLLQYYLFWQAS